MEAASDHLPAQSTRAEPSGTTPMRYFSPWLVAGTAVLLTNYVLCFPDPASPTSVSGQ